MFSLQEIKAVLTCSLCGCEFSEQNIPKLLECSKSICKQFEEKIILSDGKLSANYAIINM